MGSIGCVGVASDVLRLVADRDEDGVHGYDLAKTLEVNQSTIYRALQRLEEAGLVASRYVPAPGKGPARRVYSVTASGRTAVLDAAA